MKGQGQFKNGHIPWNKGKKGIHLSPRTEFKKGKHSKDKHPCWKGGIQRPVRDCAKVNTEIGKIRRPWLVLNKAGIKIPKGFVIYHEDGNNKNDSLENLKVISRADLLKINRAIKNGL